MTTTSASSVKPWLGWNNFSCYDAPRLTRLAWTYSWWSSLRTSILIFLKPYILHQKIKYIYAYSIAETFVKRRRERETIITKYPIHIYIYIIIYCDKKSKLWRRCNNRRRKKMRRKVKK